VNQVVRSSVSLVILALCSCADSPPDPGPAERITFNSVARDPCHGAPTVQLTPSYPAAAFAVGQQGWVLVAYDLPGDGLPENVKVLESSPTGVFDRSAVEAMQAAPFSIKGAVRSGCLFELTWQIR
jgi:TonB family protein